MRVGYQRVALSGIFGDEVNWTFGATGQVGYNFWFTERLSFWPRGLLTFEQLRSKFPGPTVVPGPMSSGSSVATGASIISAGISAPLLFHVVPHFFIGFGPTVSTDIHNSTGPDGAPNRSSHLGAASTIGGWF